MKIALIDPGGEVAGFNAGLGYLAAVLLQNNHSVCVIDFNNDWSDRNKRLESLSQWQPHVVGFSLKTHTLTNADNILRQLKSKFPASVKFFAGGPAVTCEGEAFLEQHPLYDACVAGEAEQRTAHIVDDLAGNMTNVAIAGYWKRTNKASVHLEIPLIPQLDTLSFPEYSTFDTVDLLKNKYPLVTSRGCPYECVYCAVNKISGYAWRSRSAENVVAELVEAKQRYAITGFEVADDNFTMDIVRAKRMCRLLIEKKLHLEWRCINGIRADRIDKELLTLMKSAGCTTVWFGVESLDETVFAGIKKGESISVVIQAVIWAHAAGLRVGGFFIAGLPASTYAIDRQTLKKAQQLPFDEMLWSLATPYPQTRLWELVQERGGILQNYQKVSFFKNPQAVFDTPEYPAVQRLAMVYRGNIKGFSYSCFFSQRITFGQIIAFVRKLLWYDGLRLWVHLYKIFAGTYHRAYVKEALRRIFGSQK